MVANVSRILVEEDYVSLNEFLEDLRENADPAAYKLILKRPLYRGRSYIGDYAKQPIRTDRMPASNSFQFHEELDACLKERGFCARRSNSIFATTRYKLAKSFSPHSPPTVYVVFPLKGFCFTWHPLVEDITFEALVKIGGPDVVQFDIEKALIDLGLPYARDLLIELYGLVAKMKEDREVELLYDAKDIFNSYNGNKEEVLVKMGKVLGELYNILDKRRQERIIIDAISYARENRLESEALKLNCRSKFFDYFDSTDFASALESGNEIMIHAPYCFLVLDKVFKNNYEKFEKLM